MTDKEKIKQEIERLKHNTPNAYDLSRFMLLEEIESFINSLPEESKCIYNRTLDERKKFCKYCSAACDVRIEEEPASEDLEKASIEYSCANPSERSNGMYDQTDIEWAFEAGAELQKQKDQETIELAEDHAMLAGMNKMKEEILSKAVSEVTLIDWYISSIDETIPPIWTEAHINELYRDFYLIPKEVLQ